MREMSAIMLYLRKTSFYVLEKIQRRIDPFTY